MYINVKIKECLEYVVKRLTKVKVTIYNFQIKNRKILKFIV